jgi:hypothetical protein
VRLVVGIYYFVSTSSHWGDRGFVSGLGEAEPLDMRYQAEPRNEGMEGLLVGWGEAEPLDMRYQAEPGNEGF